MARAIELARTADYRTSPNPMVGAVVLDSAGTLAGEGFHAAKGSPHAEEMALAAAGAKAGAGTIYVNLEPCAHAATELNEFYVTHRSTGRPFVSLKFAMSLDGKIATRTGESRWITGEQARNHGHQLRHMHDAILVGVNTVIKDDPQLTTRIEGDRDARQPLRVVLDSHLRTPTTARVLGERTLIATTSAGDMDCAEVLKLPPDPDGRVPIEALLDQLGQRGILSLLVEGGAETHAAFLAVRLVNKVYAYIAPKLIGGSEAPTPVGGVGIEHLNDALRLRDTEVVTLGDDILFSGHVDVHRDR